MHLRFCLLLSAVLSLTPPPARSADVPGKGTPPVKPGVQPAPVLKAQPLVPLVDPPPNAPKAAPHGEKAEAHITVAGKSHKLFLDQHGGFGRIPIPAQARIPIEVVYPDAQPGAVLVVGAMDGGTIVDLVKPQQARLDEKKQVKFTFEAGKDPGGYRVLLRKGRDLKFIEFWVGPKMPVAKRGA